MIKAQPVDVVVAIGGCDKTVPAQIMGSLSANKPVLPLVVGPMMTGSFRGQRIGACTDCRNNWAAYRAEELDIEDIAAINSELAPTAGTCGVMGTASTMACICAALGMMPLEGASAAAVSAARIRIAESTGSVAISLATDCTRRPQMVLDRKSFINAIIVLQAIGGSTNAVVHLLAIVNRHPQLAGTITLDTINEVGPQTPLLVDLKPSGDNYMTDFHNAEGMRALLENLRPLLHLDANTVFGQTLGELMDSCPFKLFPQSQRLIRPMSDPLSIHSLVALYGNIAPNGAIIKASASKDCRLLEFSGPAVVFEDTSDLERRIDDPALEVTKDSALILKSVGPVGNPGMPEAGMIPIPKKLVSRDLFQG
ncbi:dihydroxy-acid and 6-phosphogluconate dehydratase [Hortaea werneckii]|nr:dihydroxy-acid and 6-phosphogluconate dehydratase [Hortaea werneckii]KAI7593627.1 dihydroxy-acid and 6-phosphogluconate dehydratase [Hortaea werneckii]